jgi:DNA-binding PadR family transcriptional regulator
MLKNQFSDFFHAIGHHHRGGRRIGRGFDDGGGFMGGGGFLGGRKLGSADLQLVLLALLAERPAHGYELIRLLEEKSSGFYTPSPGMVYPALTYLDEIGHAAVSADGNRKLYAITEAGLAYLAENKLRAEAMLDALARIGGRMEQVREAFSGLSDIDPQAAEELNTARHGLKHALRRMQGCGPDEARRIAAILERATAEILKASGAA